MVDLMPVAIAGGGMLISGVVWAGKKLFEHDRTLAVMATKLVSIDEKMAIKVRTDDDRHSENREGQREIRASVVELSRAVSTLAARLPAA